MHTLACQVVVMALISCRGHMCSLLTLGINVRTLDSLLMGTHMTPPALVKTLRNPVDHKKLHFARAESTRMDIEIAFGVLQARWAVVRGPAFVWDPDQISNIMTACIIFHNMIIEDERDFALDRSFDNVSEEANPSTGSRRVRDSFVQWLHQLKNKSKHQ
jgi:hypothetical protein